MFNKAKTCIICNKKIDQKPIKKHGVFFCSKACVQKYEAEAKKIKTDMHLDNCC